MKQTFVASLSDITRYIELQEYKGYDPYDALNAKVDFAVVGKWGPILATQLLKRLPVNLRSLIGINREINPKAMGLFLHGYSNLYSIENSIATLEKMDNHFEWLCKNHSKGYSGYCWGYNFDWASPVKYLPAYTPSSVVTGFVCKGIYKYFLVTQNPEALRVLRSACDFILNDLPITNINDENTCISYTPAMQDCCYNASLLGAEILLKTYALTGDKSLLNDAEKAFSFVLGKQKSDGRWNYSIDPESNKERKQIDFHQGYVIDSLFEYTQLTDFKTHEYHKAVLKGAEFYKNKQFHDNGRVKWRLPKEWPVDIHNLAQGIITFSRLSVINKSYIAFATKISEWAINNMQNPEGYFHYQKYPFFTNKISYMRWGQAWMFLALTELLLKMNQK